MIYSDIIIVGGGPAGSTCAWKLRQGGRDVLVLDKQDFPRHKLCAGWITPDVLRRLEIDPGSYPHSLTRFRKLHFYIKGRHLPLPTRQYAIRRFEFDDWLLKRAAVPFFRHKVINIQRAGDEFIVDEVYRCRYLVGAGGTGCPVYRTFFRGLNQRSRLFQISTLEEEFAYDCHDPNCRLWFFDHGLSGYSWYVPKAGGYLNIGIGAKVETLLSRGETIQQHWNLFTEKLAKLGLIRDYHFQPKGYSYYLRHKVDRVRVDNAFIIGDAAGLATLDMGEGIGPAVQSGIRVAQAILTGKPSSLKSIRRFSALNILFRF